MIVIPATSYILGSKTDYHAALGCSLELFVDFMVMSAHIVLRTPGVKPRSQAWEACMVPLHYVRFCHIHDAWCRSCPGSRHQASVV